MKPLNLVLGAIGIMLIAVICVVSMVVNFVITGECFPND